MIAKFNGNSSTTIIFCYHFTDASDETDLDTFYNELSSFVRSMPKYNVLIIGGDLIAQKLKTKSTNSAYTARQTEMGST